MSLYSSIRMAANTLQADQIAMQVVGQNIANANTPGYLREEVILKPAPTQKQGNLLMGMGVEVQAVVQKVDHFLEQRLRSAVSDRSSSEIIEQTYYELEGIINELSDTDLSTSLNNFFSSISEILNQPESASVRNLAVLEGSKLAQEINRTADRAISLRNDLNDRVGDMGERINRLTEEIRDLNLRISDAEGGNVSASDAVGLRDQRMLALENLAKLINIRVDEQPHGGVTIYNGGDFLVFDGVRREVEAVEGSDRGMTVSTIRLVETDSPLELGAGELAGLIHSRDDILGGFLDQINDFARNLAFEFNKVFSGGQGLNGYSEITSEFAVDAGDLALNEAGLPFTPVNGSFQVMIHNTQTGLTQTTDILVDLNGMGDEMTMTDLVTALDAISGLSAEVTPTGKLHLVSASADQQFAFADDTSGLLAALGVNTFFSGSTATDLGVSEAIRRDPAKFAASQGGVGADTSNTIILAALADHPIDARNGESIRVIYDRMTSEAAQGSTISRAEAEGNRVFEETLRGQKLATSGVSIDEEAIKLMAYQHSFQATARYIGVLGELLETLVNL